MTKAKALYQVKLIFDAMEESDYKRIPKETIEYVENNMEYDENIKIDPNIPLEEQNIDDYACDFLEKMIDDIERREKQEGISANEASAENTSNGMDVESLKALVEKLKLENSKIPQMKELVTKYKTELENKNIEINNLKKRNEELYAEIEKVPKIFRRLFLGKLEKKLLN